MDLKALEEEIEDIDESFESIISLIFSSGLCIHCGEPKDISMQLVHKCNYVISNEEFEHKCNCCTNRGCGVCSNCCGEFYFSSRYDVKKQLEHIYKKPVSR